MHESNANVELDDPPIRTKPSVAQITHNAERYRAPARVLESADRCISRMTIVTVGV